LLRPLFIKARVDISIGLFWSCQQKDDRPPKEEDHKRDELFDQFWIHQSSFFQGNEIGCLFLEDEVLEIYIFVKGYYEKFKGLFQEEKILEFPEFFYPNSKQS